MIKAAVLACALAIVGGQKVNLANWKETDNGPWSAREGLMGVSYKDNLYLSAGRQFFGVSFSSQVWRSENDGATWILASEKAFPARAYHVHLVQGDCMFIAGGQTFTTFYNDVWKSCDGKGEVWEVVTHAAPWAPRAGLAAWVHSVDHTLIIAGGCYNNNKLVRSFLGDVWASPDGGVTWEQRTAQAEWKARSGPRLIEGKEHQLVLLAGEVGFTTDTQLVDVWSSIDGGRTWQLVTATPGFSPRSGHGVVLAPVSKAILVIAGWPHLHDLWVSTDNGVSFTQSSNTVWDCNEDACGKFDFWPVVHHGKLFTLGGSGAYSTFGTLFKDTWQSDFQEMGNLRGAIA